MRTLPNGPRWRDASWDIPTKWRWGRATGCELLRSVCRIFVRYVCIWIPFLTIWCCLRQIQSVNIHDLVPICSWQTCAGWHTCAVSALKSVDERLVFSRCTQLDEIHIIDCRVTREITQGRQHWVRRYITHCRITVLQLCNFGAPMPRYLIRRPFLWFLDSWYVHQTQLRLNATASSHAESNKTKVSQWRPPLAQCSSQNYMCVHGDGLPRIGLYIFPLISTVVNLFLVS